MPRRTEKKKYAKPAPTTGNKYSLLCLDSETTNHGELLELSVFDITGKEVFHSYFRPRAKNWPTEIHHITPEMVASSKSFGASRYRLQRLFNKTTFILGCAVSNDLHTLERYGVKLSNKHIIFDIQNFYWLLNDKSGRREKNQTGLAAIASHYGLGFVDGHQHSATADTRLTVECFRALVKHFTGEEVPETFEGLLELKSRYDQAYGIAMCEFRMRNLAGFVNVVKREQGFSLKFTRFRSTTDRQIVLIVPVEDRVKAEKELREKLFERQIKGFTGIYDLDAHHFEFISNYKNKIELEEFLARENEKTTNSKNFNSSRTISKKTTFYPGRNKMKR